MDDAWGSDCPYCGEPVEESAVVCACGYRFVLHQDEEAYAEEARFASRKRLSNRISFGLVQILLGVSLTIGSLSFSEAAGAGSFLVFGGLVVSGLFTIATYRTATA